MLSQAVMFPPLLFVMPPPEYMEIPTGMGSVLFAPPERYHSWPLRSSVVVGPLAVMSRMETERIRLLAKLHVVDWWIQWFHRDVRPRRTRRLGKPPPPVARNSQYVASNRSAVERCVFHLRFDCQ
jgi:hypothetical protein